jgi:hypothetical protein
MNGLAPLAASVTHGGLSSLGQEKARGLPCFSFRAALPGSKKKRAPTPVQKVQGKYPAAHGAPTRLHAYGSVVNPLGSSASGIGAREIARLV